MGAESLILFFIFGILLVGGGIVVSFLIAPRSKNAVKDEAYECGIPTKGESWVQFRVGYYLFAILFLIFEVETIFMIPWAVVMKDLGMVAFIEIMIFLAIVLLGLLYAWNRGALKWD